MRLRSVDYVNLEGRGFIPELKQPPLSYRASLTCASSILRIFKPNMNLSNLAYLKYLGKNYVHKLMSPKFLLQANNLYPQEKL